MIFNAAVLALTAVAVVPVQARFGQQNPPAEGLANAAVGGGIAGQIPSALLGAADPCLKLSLADTIAAAKPGDAAALTAAKALVNTEKNFNPFTPGALPTLCNDPALPKTPELRGILALVSDQDLPTKFGANGGLTAAQINAIATKSLTTPIANNAGKSVAQLFADQGFKDFVGADKLKVAAVAAAPPPAADNKPTGTGAAKAVVTTTVTVTRAASATECAAAGNNVTPPPPPPAVGGNTGAGAGATGGNAGNGGKSGLSAGVIAQLKDLLSQMVKVLG